MAVKWDMVVALFEKIWCGTKSVYQNLSHPIASHELNQYLNKLLRQDAQILRDLLTKGASRRGSNTKENLLQKKFLTSALTLDSLPAV